LPLARLPGEAAGAANGKIKTARTPPDDPLDQERIASAIGVNYFRSERRGVWVSALPPEGREILFRSGIATAQRRWVTVNGCL
jgi:hypothetical protein